MNKVEKNFSQNNSIQIQTPPESLPTNGPIIAFKNQ
jgi:hypothetical protein